MLTEVNDIGAHLCLWALGGGYSLFWEPKNFPSLLASATKMHVIPRWLSASRRLKTGSIHGSCSMKKTRNCVLGWSRWKTKFYRQRILALKKWLKSYRRWVGVGCPCGGPRASAGSKSHSVTLSHGNVHVSRGLFFGLSKRGGRKGREHELS